MDLFNCPMLMLVTQNSCERSLQFLNMFLWLLTCTPQKYIFIQGGGKNRYCKIKLFYEEVKSKRKNKCMRLQVNNEFQQVKIKDLNEENKAEMFTSSVRDEKAFATEQKISKLKTRIAKLSAQKLKITPTKIIQNSVLSMKTMESDKYGQSPEGIERRSLAGERYKTIFNMHSKEKTKKPHDRLDRYD